MRWVVVLTSCLGQWYAAVCLEVVGGMGRNRSAWRSLICRLSCPQVDRLEGSIEASWDGVVQPFLLTSYDLTVPSLLLQVDRLEGSVEASWEGLVQPLERIVDRLSRAWGTVSHLKAVKDTEELRKVRQHRSEGRRQCVVWREEGAPRATSRR